MHLITTANDIDPHQSSIRGAEDDLRLVVNLNELDEQQRRKLADFVYSIVYPTDSVRLNDDQTELVIVRVRRK